MYLSHFEFPDIEQEYTVRFSIKRTCYDSFYPFGILSRHHFTQIDFEPVTILYGGNGCGKSTALNVIAQKLGLKRGALYNRSDFFEDYVDMCTVQADDPLPKDSRMITSDDVFDFMLDLRSVNQGIDQRRETLFDEYMDAKCSRFQMKSMEDYEALKKSNLAKRTTQSKFVRKNLKNNIREHSNGESAFLYFSEIIRENALYLLDEPENSLCAQKQQELAVFLEDSARFFRCQLVIATHSPFLLAIRGAKIYDMDEDPVDVKKWTRLENVKAYYEFFKKHKEEFS
ncbi:MAG TPA: AAA family ATPase [Candidatus Scybalocola faecavium]|nr:AAA family ATPase [Candidatus Scybalocola faecavium]